MSIKDIKKNIHQKNNLWLKLSKEPKERASLLSTIKLIEELGEFANELLSFSTIQRKDKTKTRNNKRLAEELADFIIVALLLAENLEIDVWSEIEKKLKKPYK